MALAPRAAGAREIGVLLHERLFTDLAVDPCRGGLREQCGREHVVAGDADGGRVVFVDAGC